MGFFITLLLIAINTGVYAKHNSCKATQIAVQILGSGGPELTVDRASSSYLLWINHKAVVMIDAGGGSALRYGQSQAQWQDLKVLLLTHLHADHSSDLPALIKASWFVDRDEDLPVFGPSGNAYMPSTTEFMDALLDKNTGAYRYLADLYTDNHGKSYKLVAHTVADAHSVTKVYQDDTLLISAQAVKHGPIPALAYVLEICGKTIVFSGDTNSQGLEQLQIKQTDVFVAHNAIPENAGEIAKNLHMTPVQIGQMARHLNSKKLILSHRMQRTLGKEQQTEKYIKQAYDGIIQFASDMDVIKID